MKKHTIWLVIGCLVVTSLFPMSCSPTVTEDEDEMIEEKSVVPTEKEQSILVEAAAGDLENVEWVLQNYGERNDLQSVLDGTHITAVFESGVGEVWGFSGCNIYSGKYELDGDKLSIDSLDVSTNLVCTEPITEQEQEYLSILETAESYKITGILLEIYCNQKMLIYWKSEKQVVFKSDWDNLCETWESAKVGIYRPNDEPYPDTTMILGDFGEWRVGDTPSWHFADTEILTPNYAEIVEENGNKYLKLVSVDTDLIFDRRDFENRFAEDIFIRGASNIPFIPFVKGLIFSFESDWELSTDLEYEGGQLVAQPHDYPIWLAIKAVVEEPTRPGTLGDEYSIYYTFGRGEHWEPYSKKVKVLSSNNGIYTCNLYRDFTQGHKAFRPDNATVRCIDLEVPVPGWITLDNLCFKVQEVPLEEEVEEEVTLPDLALEQWIRMAISKIEGPIYPSDLEELTDLAAPQGEISDLTGLENCTNLTSLWIDRNPISDISALASLTELRSIILNMTMISDISPLASLANLTFLDLRYNLIEDISCLISLTNLTEVWLDGNPLNTDSVNLIIPQLEERGTKVYY